MKETLPHQRILTEKLKENQRHMHFPIFIDPANTPFHHVKDGINEKETKKSKNQYKPHVKWPPISHGLNNLT